MGTNKNAGAVIFGFDFQIDAAICLFIRNIELIEKIKVEGKYEDIEQFLFDGSIIYCQVKSVINATKNDPRVKRQKLRDALDSLSKCELNNKDKLVYCSNQKDPLIANDSRFTIEDIIEFEYNYLDEKSKELINKYFKKNISNISKLSVIKIPYVYSPNKEIKVQYIYNCIKDFLINVDGSFLGYRDITLKWHDFLKDSAYGKVGEFYVEKSDLIWILICVTLEKMVTSVQVPNENLIYKISEKKEYILNSLMNFQIYNILLDIYNSDKSDTKNIDEIFLSNKSKILETIFGSDEIENADIISAKIIFESIIATSNRIEKVKEVCNLANR